MSTADLYHAYRPTALVSRSQASAAKHGAITDDESTVWRSS